MIQLNDRDYENLLEARNAMAAALQRLANVSEAVVQQGDGTEPKQLAEAVAVARGLLAKYGEHQAFIVI
ncbi:MULTISPECIES: hypothetical protein [Paraburkholderia]|uniref:Uncharacterized protein n=1 Tax=Paraburkholderia metrosideri TaxID=580937 RepID=A0ABW9E4C3_9BURK